jgi:amino acid adenylation domain-containing protein
MKTESQISEAAADRLANLSPAKRALLAQRLKAKEQAGQGQRLIPRRSSGDAAAPAPLSFDQERHWFIDQLETNHAVNNAPDGVLLKGRLKVPALEQALGEIIRRHEILRATFKIVDGSPAQVIAPATSFRLPLINLSDLSGLDQQRQLRRLAQAEESRRFDLAAGPLLRAALLRFDEETHVLLLTAHHIVCDSWSVEVLNRELGALYQAYTRGERSPLEELPIQFGDFAAWQRQRLQGEFLDELLAYWKGQLAGASAVLDLPTDRARPAVQSYRGATESMELSDAALKSLQRLSREAGATLFMTLLAAFKALLSRYTNSDDIVVGTPNGGRHQLQTEPLIGLFVNTLALRTQVCGSMTFSELLGRVSETAKGALAHRELPFERLVAELQPERLVSHTPLFQVMFDLQRPVKISLAFPELTVSPLESVSQTAKFDLHISVTEKTDGLTIALKYNADLFEAETMQRMLGHTRHLLESIIYNPQQRLSELSLLSHDEEHQLLRQWNETKVDYGAGLTLHQLFEEQTERTPDAVALVFEDHSLTYSELNSRANQLARFLQLQGVGPESLVPICIERSLHMVIGLLGILKAGAAYLPLDPSYPQERLAFMLNDAQAHLLLTENKLARQLPPIAARLVLLDDDWPLISEQSADNCAASATEQNLAYLIYTSGSTGQPKGAMISHQGLCNRLLWMQSQYGLDASDRVLQKTPFSFDVSGWEFFWPLITGATLVIAKPEGHKDSAYLVELINREQITTLHFVPSMLAVFLEEEGLARRSSLRRVVCSGEALSLELQERFLSRIEAELDNLYGPTEASIDVTYWRCEAEEQQRSVPIGRPIANTEIYVLDEEMKPTSVGVAGELYIGGVGLGRGYWQRAKLTAEKFVPHPHSSADGERLYRSGDLARFGKDGRIEYLGRLDYQVKIRGFRIELGEIEAALMEQAGVREAAVVAQEETPGSSDKRLVAYLVREREDEALDVDRLRATLRERLPEYMVPSAFVMLAEMPLTSSGKINRRALPLPEQSTPAMKRAYQPPQTDAERTIAAIWQEALKVEKVGLTDNFFDLGGHSLSMVKVFTKLRGSFEREFTVIDLFRFPTVSAVAQFLQPTEEQRASALQSQEQEAARLTAGKDRLRQMKQRRQASLKS